MKEEGEGEGRKEGDKGDGEREGERERQRWRYEEGGSTMLTCYSLYLYQVGEPFDVYVAVQQLEGVGSQSTGGH